MKLDINPIRLESPLSLLNRKALLGQVFTPDILAQFMVTLLKSDFKESYRLLDPCIGPNTFFSFLKDIKVSEMVGVEIDEALITNEIKTFYAQPKRNLILDSFFNFPLSEKFDIIIQNPPYIRQELLLEGENSKVLAIQSLSSLFGKIPAKSNLYVYFLLKSILHLKNNGRLIAVIYDSWLYSDFGKFLKEVFISSGSIEGIYHFKENAFPDAEVGATVIDFKKILIHSQVNSRIKFYSFNTVDEINSFIMNSGFSPKQIPVQEFLDYRFNEETIIDFRIPLFKSMKQTVLRPIQRGTATIANKYFIQQKKIFNESIPFVKDVSLIKSFNTINQFSYLLALDENISSETNKYLNSVKNEILLNGEKFKTLKTQIQGNKNWYKTKLKKPGNILFNYYLRKNIDFLLNDELYYASDNFYILNIEQNLLTNFAILNSSFTRLAVLRHSRNQGKGLRKIQLYEFKEIPILDSNKLSKDSIIKLKILGEKLKSVNRFSETKDKIIKQIDEILLKEYNQKSKIQITISHLYNDIKNNFSPH